MEARRAVERALTTAKHDPVAAARMVFRTLFGGNEFHPMPPELAAMVAALADRATSLTMTPRAGNALPLGDSWFACPHCADVFEGEQPTCASCERRLVMSAPALHIDFAGAHIWLRPSTAEKFRPVQDLAWIASAIEWMRVESGSRWFETTDEAKPVVAMPPNVVPVGLCDDGTIILAHETKLDVYTVRGDAVVVERAKLAPAILVQQIAVLAR